MNVSNQPFDLDRLRQLTTLFAIFGTFLVNTLSNFYPLNGLNIGAISNTLFAQVQIVPASYAFVIWGVIYLGLFALGIYQARPSQRQNSALRRIGFLLVWACGAQAIWVFIFLSRWFALSTIAMVGILLPLIGAYLRLDVGCRPVTRAEQWWVHRPVSLYLGWITVASIVNVALALYAHNWTGWGIAPSIWTMGLMMISAIIAAVITLQRRDLVFTGVIVWALVAISLRQMTEPLIWITGAIAVSVLVLLVLGLWVGQKRSLQ